jgi:hypothetical protein
MNVFIQACTALFGPNWQTEAARQLTISLSSVLRYANGERVVPREVYETLSKLIDRRLDELSGLRPKVRRAGDPPGKPGATGDK